MNKLWLSAGVVALVALVIGTISWQSAHKSFSPEESSLESCKTLAYNNPNGINLLFFSKKGDAEKYSDFLLSRKPFDTNKKKFNIYYIDDYTPPCSLYRSIALLCDSREVTEKAASCPHDFVFVLKEEDTTIRSSAYGIVGSINTAHPLTVIEHEFGHLFANFAEEYTPANLPAGQPNCKQSCDEFGEFSKMCFNDCSDSSHQRSIENGVMRTLDSDKYGMYNEKTIFSIINSLTPESKSTGFAIENTQSCTGEKQLLIQGHYTSNKLVLDSVKQTHGCAPSKNAGSSQAAISQKGTSISSLHIAQNQYMFTDAPGENTLTGETYQPEEDFYFSIPSTEGDELTITDQNNNQASLSLAKTGATPCRIE
jgi:hypothetical protein